MKKNKVGCLILHGFAGTCADMAVLTERVVQTGCSVSVPLLAGHGAGRKALAQVRYADWLRSAEEALRELECRCEKVIVIGFSMGGLIGLQLCRNHKVSALVLINTPLYIWNRACIVRNLCQDFRLYTRKYFVPRTDIPLHAYWEFISFLRGVRPTPDEIETPAMIVQTLDDDTVNPRSLVALCTGIRGLKQIVTCPEGGHMVFRHPAGEKVCETVCGFLRRIEIDGGEAR